MKLKTRCGQCDAGFSFNADLLGESRSCPKCGEELVINADISHPRFSAEGVKQQDKFLEAESSESTCPFCKEQILPGAVKCKHCGEFLNKSEQKKKKGPVAGVLSLFIPGSGQMYKGEFASGLFMFIVVCGLYLSMIPLFQLVGLAFHLATVADAALRFNA